MRERLPDKSQIFDVMPRPVIRAGCLFLRRERPGFNPEWGAEIERKVRRQLDDSDLQVHIPGVRITNDRSLRQAVEDCRNNSCDVLIALQATMSDGRLAPVLAQLCGGTPVVLWATPEKQSDGSVSACSLVGTHTFAAAIRQLGGAFELVYGMPAAAETEKSLYEAVHIAYTAGRLKKGSAGLIGYHAPGFIDMHADPFLLNRALGMQMRHIGIEEFRDSVKGQDAEEVKQDLSVLQSYALPLTDVGQGDLELAGRYYLALKQAFLNETLDALAVRDWPELSATQWPYLAMARLASEGFAVGCEGDVDGAISCLIATLLGLGSVYLSDWLEHDEESVTLWHGGNAPFQMTEPSEKGGSVVIAPHFNNRKPAVVNARLKVGRRVTVFRLWHCDNEYRLTAAEAQTIEPGNLLYGTNGRAVFKDRNVKDWFETLCHEGLPHHVGVVMGHHRRIFFKLSRQLGIKWVE